MNSRLELRIDPERAGIETPTHIPVRAFDSSEGYWRTADIAELDRDSLVEWIRSRGEVSSWGVQIILILLGHPTTGVE